MLESWISDSALEKTIKMFRTGEYSKVVCTGGPIELGSHLYPFASYPEMTASRLKKMGIDSEKIIVVTADFAKKDRTYMAALALRKMLTACKMEEKNLHLITAGPHGRRSHLLFRKALGKEYDIGVTSLPPDSYVPKEWYKFSEGVRSVMSELLAYLYVKLFFHP